jgi:hypothetical protein
MPRVFLAAPTLTRLAPAELAPAVRARFGAELRRLGVFAQLCQLGAQACLEAAAPQGRLGVLLATRRGAVSATRAALGSLARGEPVMPFTFIATQTNLAGAILARGSHDVARAACLYLEAQDWPWLLRIGRQWLAQCERVAVGWVEEAAPGEAHRSDWCLLLGSPAASAIGCEPSREPGAPATTGDWMARVSAWRPGARTPLVLGGRGGGWRFSA